MISSADLALVLLEFTLCKGKPRLMVPVCGANACLQSRHSNTSLTGLPSTHGKAHKAAKRVSKSVDTSTGQKSEKTKVWKP
jgi:hypothetical protein